MGHNTRRGAGGGAGDLDDLVRIAIVIDAELRVQAHQAVAVRPVDDAVRDEILVGE